MGMFAILIAMFPRDLPASPDTPKEVILVKRLQRYQDQDTSW